MKYYHVTDLLLIGAIMRNGLKCRGGLIHAYKELSLTHSFAVMISGKGVKDLRLLPDKVQVEPTIWQLYREVIGIVEIDARGIDDVDNIFDDDHVRIRQDRIMPDYLQFIGGYNMLTRKIEPIDITPFERLYNSIMEARRNI